MNRVELKSFAWKRLTENRWPMVIVALILTIVGGASVFRTTVNIDITNLPQDSGEVMEVVSQQVSPVLTIIGFLVTALLANPLKVGAAHFFRKNIYENAVIEDITRGFSNYINTVITMFIVTAIVSIGTVLCIVPGIILGLGLALVPYILAENPSIGISDALLLSWNKMKGHKTEWFILGLSFIGWILLTVVTCGIVGVLFYGPYSGQTFAVYADRILNGQAEPTM